jgi:hypothetical protein
MDIEGEASSLHLEGIPCCRTFLPPSSAWILKEKPHPFILKAFPVVEHSSLPLQHGY